MLNWAKCDARFSLFRFFFYLRSENKRHKHQFDLIEMWSIEQQSINIVSAAVLAANDFGVGEIGAKI